MYNYSPIKTLHIKNFRNLGDVEVDFTKSPIVTLVGENEAGKTSLIKAFAMCALHDSPRDQKDYIRDGTNRLGVQITLEDNTEIIRVKDLNGLNLYRVIYPDGKQWDATKLTDGLPEPVSRAMGLTVEPETGEYLNIRSYEDKLLFVMTPSSTNYKVMYNALKVEQLTKAIKNGSNEVNVLKSTISKAEASSQTLYNQLKGITVVDTEPLTNIRDRLKEQISLLDKLEGIMKLVDEQKEIEAKIGALALLDIYKLQSIDEALTMRLSNVSNLLSSKKEIDSRMSVYSDLNNISEIDTRSYEKAKSIKESADELIKMSSKASALQPINDIEMISEWEVVSLSSLGTMVEQLNTINNRLEAYKDLEGIEFIGDDKLGALNTINAVKQMMSENVTRENYLEQYNNYIEQIENYMKQCGVAVETCPKCGEAIIFDLDKMQ